MSDPLRPEDKAIVDDEVGMAARVGRRIAKSLAERSEARPQEKRVRLDTELMQLRDQIGEARNEDVAALVAQMMRTAGVMQVGGPKATGIVDPAVPYFGHLRLHEGKRTRDVLIGRRGMIDREAGVVIVDWRDAPVSRLYYRYDEGDEYEEELGDRLVEGTMVARRTVTFQDGNLVRVRCPSGVFVRPPPNGNGHNGETNGDDAWRTLGVGVAPELRGGVGKAERAPPIAQSARGQRGKLGLGDGHLRPDKHLPEITALIDAAQFDAMTRPDSGVVILQGGAGSGKTTVALHRVAYLAFADPERFTPERMMVVVAQPQLARYVERLLPSLDVSGVRVFAYLDWSRAAVETLLGGPRKKKHANRLLGRRFLDEVPADVARIKKHPRVLEAIRAHQQKRLDAFDAELRAALDGREQAALVLEQWDRSTGKAHAVRYAELESALEAIKLPEDTRERAARVVSRVIERSNDVVADWEELITDRALLGPLAESAELDVQGFESVMRYTARQIAELPDLSELDEEMRHPVDAIGDGDDPDDPIQAFDACDAALLLNLWVERWGDLGKLQMEHVAVDEAQDLSAIELRPLLAASGPSRSLTLAGDVVQKVAFDTGYDEWIELEAQLGIEAQNVEPLKLSYRSTAEVVSFARDVLGPLAPPEPPRAVRSGAPVEVFAFADPGEEIAFLAETLRSLMAREPLASVALLLRYPERARFYNKMLQQAEVPRLRLVLGARDAHDDTHDDFTFAPGIDITHTSRVKGLEYDYVILAEVTEAMYPEAIAARHLLHIGATRAAHQLWITTATDAASPLLPAHLLTM